MTFTALLYRHVSGYFTLPCVYNNITHVHTTVYVLQHHACPYYHICYEIPHMLMLQYMYICNTTPHTFIVHTTIYVMQHHMCSCYHICIYVIQDHTCSCYHIICTTTLVTYSNRWSRWRNWFSRWLYLFTLLKTHHKHKQHYIVIKSLTAFLMRNVFQLPTKIVNCCSWFCEQFVKLRVVILLFPLALGVICFHWTVVREEK